MDTFRTRLTRKQYYFQNLGTTFIEFITITILITTNKEGALVLKILYDIAFYNLQVILFYSFLIFFFPFLPFLVLKDRSTLYPWSNIDKLLYFLLVYRTRAIITRSWFETALDYKPSVILTSLALKNGVKNIQTSGYNGARTVSYQTLSLVSKYALKQ